MDLKIIVILTILFSCFLIILRVLKGLIDREDGWIMISLFISLITSFLLLFNISLSCWIGGILYLTLIIIPQWGLNWINRLIEIQNYQKARQFFSKLFWLHPTTIWRHYLQLFLALELADNGHPKKAINILKKNTNYVANFNYYYQLRIYEILGNWDNCLQWLIYQVKEEILWKDPLLLTYYIRALGETGELNQLFDNFLKVESTLLKFNKYSYIARIKLYALAFSGQTVAIIEIFKNELSFYPKYLQEFWLITAKTMINHNPKNYKIFLQKCSNHHYILKASLQWRLNKSSIQRQKNLPESAYKTLYILNFKNKNINQKFTSLKIKNQTITSSLILVNLVVFIIELSFGGSENIETLYQLGALIPMIVWEGEFWRLITANFLHYGWGHLLMNMMGLYIIGNLVESLSNKYCYLLIYLISGIGAMFLFSYVSIYTHKLDYILVGASASIMGLVGSLTAIFLHKWYKNKSSINLKRLLVILIIIALQFISDLLIPQVSILSHLFGLLIGFILEFVWLCLINLC
jgi:rhomboid protease GluP